MDFSKVKVVEDLAKTWYDIFPRLPRLLSSDSIENDVYTYAGHRFNADVTPVFVKLGKPEASKQDYIELARQFSLAQDGRALHCYLGVICSLVEVPEDGYYLLTIPVFLNQANPTPKMYRKDGGELPKYATSNSCGFDICCKEGFEIEPGERKVISTGLFLDTANWDGTLTYLKLDDKSGLAAKYGITILAGNVDNDYEDEIKVVMLNTGKETVVFENNQRICQGIWLFTMQGGNLPIIDAKREGGFGSTGV